MSFNSFLSWYSCHSQNVFIKLNYESVQGVRRLQLWVSTYLLLTTAVKGYECRKRMWDSVLLLIIHHRCPETRGSVELKALILYRALLRQLVP